MARTLRSQRQPPPILQTSKRPSLRRLGKAEKGDRTLPSRRDQRSAAVARDAAGRIGRAIPSRRARSPTSAPSSIKRGLAPRWRRSRRSRPSRRTAPRAAAAASCERRSSGRNGRRSVRGCAIHSFLVEESPAAWSPACLPASSGRFRNSRRRLTFGTCVFSRGYLRAPAPRLARSAISTSPTVCVDTLYECKFASIVETVEIDFLKRLGMREHELQCCQTLVVKHAS